MGLPNAGGSGGGAKGAPLRQMFASSIDAYLAEVIRLLMKASDAVNEDERLRLIRRASVWLDVAKLRTDEQ